MDHTVYAKPDGVGFAETLRRRDRVAQAQGERCVS